MEINFIFFNTSNVYTNKDFLLQNKVRFDKHSIVADIIYKIHQVGIKKFFPENTDFFPTNIPSEWMWVLEEQGKREIFIVYGDGRVHPIVDIALPISFWIQDIENPVLYFKFYSTHKKRAKDLILRYEGNKEKMNLDNVNEEYKNYTISIHDETKWLNEQKKEKEYENNLLYLKKQQEIKKELRKKHLALIIRTVIIFLILFLIGLNFCLLPIRPDSKLAVFLYTSLNISNLKIFYDLSLFLGLFLIILSIVVVFLAIRKYEQNNII